MNSILSDALRGALIGAGVGAGLCAMSSAMKMRQTLASTVGEDLGLDCPWLRADDELCELVWRFQEIAEHGPQLFESLVRNCDDLVKIAHDDPRPTRQIHANRALVAARTAAIALCRMAAARGAPRGAELRSVVDELEALCNNHLHNVMTT